MSNNELEEYFIYRCYKGLEQRSLNGKPEYEERLKYEIDVVRNFGFCSYFLVVSDIIRWARSNRILVGPGRGSACGSLISFVLKITNVDPIKYGLYFERFINVGRSDSPPDVDFDIPDNERDKVVQYIINKYGADHVARIGTFGTMKAKGAIRDVTRALGYSYELGDKLARMTLEPIEGKAQPLSVCYDKVKELHNIRYGEPSDAQTILAWAEQMEDRIRSVGAHASGIVISPDPISQVVPLCLSKDKEPTTQFEMKNVETVGLVKFDVLGLKALTTIGRCLKLIKQRHNKDIDILNIPVDDPKVYDLLQKGNTVGVFQLEASESMRDLVVKVRPTCIDDIATILAVFRPGPLGSGAVEEWLKVRAGEKDPDYITSKLEPILKRTNGLLVFQEQVMEICQRLAGYSLADSDKVRKAIGKKKLEEMKAQEDKFRKGCRQNGIAREAIDHIWQEFLNHASYSFNKSHAISYSYITYFTAYLKVYYPLEHMCSCLISDSDETDKVIQYINHCQNSGITITGPSVNESETDFSISKDGKAILFGLTAIKNLGAPVSDIIREREDNGIFTDILDFSRRVDLTKINKRKLESLVLAGAFDTLGGYNRASLLAAIEQILIYKEEQKRYESKYDTYEKKMAAFNERLKYIEEFEKDPVGKKRLNSFRKPELPRHPKLPSIPNLEELPIEQILLQEKELIGYYISGHPLDLVTEKISTNIKQIKDKGEHQQKCSLIAIPSSISETTTKKTKQKMCYIELEDKTGTISAVVFPKTYAEYKNLIDISTPARYEVEIEINEGDIGKTIKLKVMSVTELESVKSRRAQPLTITIPFKEALLTAKMISALPKGSTPVNLLVQGDSCLWDFGTFSCQGSKLELAKKLKGS